MFRPTHALAGLALTLCLGCPPGAASTDTAADEQAISAIFDSWTGAVASQNDSVIATLYADDAVLMPAGMPRVTGRQNIRGFWAQLWPVKATLTLTLVSIRVSGDLAVQEDNWTMSVPTPQGEVKDHGKALVVWRRTGNSWQVVHDIWNSDVTPPTAPAN